MAAVTCSISTINLASNYAKTLAASSRVSRPRTAHVCRGCQRCCVALTDFASKALLNAGRLALYLGGRRGSHQKRISSATSKGDGGPGGRRYPAGRVAADCVSWYPKKLGFRSH